MYFNFLAKELNLNVDFFRKVFFDNEEIWKCLRESIYYSKGREEFFYPYIEAEVVKVLKVKKKIEYLKRIGSGKVLPDRKEKIDSLLEVCNKTLGIEVKIRNRLNGLIFGYGGPQEFDYLDHGYLAGFFKENIDTVKECIPRAQGKKKITDCLITDYIKLAKFIACNFLDEGIVIGITRKEKCQIQRLKDWLRKILDLTKEFAKNINLVIATNIQIEVEEKNDLILIWIYLY